MVILQSPIEPRGHSGTARSYGIIETTVTLCDRMEPRCHCVTVQSHGTKESILTLQGLMEARGHCATVEPRRTLRYCWASWKQRSVVILWDLMEPRGNCDAAEPQGSKNMEQTLLAQFPGARTGPADLGMLRIASHLPLKSRSSVLSFL